jgi:hypothetical protein
VCVVDLPYSRIDRQILNKVNATLNRINATLNKVNAALNKADTALVNTT